MRRVFSERLLSVAAVVVLLMALAALNDGVREHVARRLFTRPTVEVSSAVHRVRAEAGTIAVTARAHSQANQALLVFALAAVVLVLFMLRT
jgi:limonene-1,2-epoxide hydrolase